MNALLITCGITVLVTALRGMKRGLFGIVYGIASWVVIIAIVSSAGPVTGKALMQIKPLHDSVADFLAPFAAVFSQEILTEIENQSSGSGEDEESGESLGILYDYFQSFAGTEEYLEDYENHVLYGTDIDSGNFPEAAGFKANDTLTAAAGESVTEKFVEIFFEILGMALCYVVAKGIMLFLKLIIYGLVNKKSSTGLNPLGLLWGIVEGGLYVCVYFIFISKFQFLSIARVMMGWIKETPALLYLYENNPLLRFFM